MKNFNFSSKKGFTLIELLVVIGILAVLAAIAIPTVAGLIDRANVSADKTNANEMTNAVERFASEYELYCQDIASGKIKDTTNLDSAQGRVYNVTGATTRADIEKLEGIEGLNGRAINRDTKYPVNAETMQAIVENYTKTSSATFEPKQSDMHYWYSPDCGIVVFDEPDASKDDLNGQIVSGKDAKGNTLDGDTEWIDMTLGASLSGGDNISIDMSTVKPTLAENDWETIQKIAQAGKVAEAGWTVGSTKELKINNTTYTARIIGINHDGNGTITFALTDIYDYQVMFLTNDNGDGWDDSHMRKWLNETVFNSIYDDLKPYIKTVPKYTNNVGVTNNSNDVSVTNDKLFLLSLKEIGAPSSYSYCPEITNLEGEAYEYYTNDAVRVTNDECWLRSSVGHISSRSFYLICDSDIYSGSGGSAGAQFAFVIG